MSRAPSTVSNNASSPAACPSVRLRPRCLAHRPLPSMTMATWRGIRPRSRAPGGTVRTYIDPSRLDRRPVRSPAMRWTAVVNPTAGRGRTRKLLPRLTEALATTGLDVDVCVSDDLDDAVRLAKEAFDDGRGVAACGGDGTVNALAGVAADHGGVLGIVPTGAGNDFARHLGLDRRRWLEAIPLLTTGPVGTVDLGR